eukprot:9414544-Alexandrium_andersonii.AAC.1
MAAAPAFASRSALSLPLRSYAPMSPACSSLSPRCARTFSMAKVPVPRALRVSAMRCQTSPSR